MPAVASERSTTDALSFRQGMMPRTSISHEFLTDCSTFIGALIIPQGSLHFYFHLSFLDLRTLVDKLTHFVWLVAFSFQALVSCAFHPID